MIILLKKTMTIPAHSTISSIRVVSPKKRKPSLIKGKKRRKMRIRRPQRMWRK